MVNRGVLFGKLIKIILIFFFLTTIRYLYYLSFNKWLINVTPTDKGQSGSELEKMFDTNLI